MKKIFLFSFFLASCSLPPYYNTPESNVPDSSHVPSYSAPGPLFSKLQGTVWKLNETSASRDRYLFFDRLESKYAILSVPEGQLPARYPNDSEYIKVSPQEETSENQQVLRKEHFGIGSNPKYFGIALKSTGRGLQTSDGTDITTINAILTSQTGSDWQLYQR